MVAIASQDDGELLPACLMKLIDLYPSAPTAEYAFTADPAATTNTISE